MGTPLSHRTGGPAPRTVHPSRSAESPSERAVQGVTETAPPRDKILPVGGKLVLVQRRTFLPTLQYRSVAPVTHEDVRQMHIFVAMVNAIGL
jgi:hypothetical protein